MQLKSLKETSYNELLESFNLAFSDYFIPVSVGIEQFTTKLEAHNIDLSLSVGAYEDNKLVGFILHGVIPYIGKKIIYNLGTGVIPSARGVSLTSKMYEFIIPKLIKSGCEQVQLEVVTNNAAAIISYLNSGFTNSRELLCYKGIITKGEANQDYNYKIVENINWNKLMSFWDKNPTIQNSPELVNNRLNELSIIGAYGSSELIGYVIYNSNENSIMQLAVHPNHRRKKVGSTLISKLGIDSEVRVINVNKSCIVTNAFLESFGLRIFVEQNEMQLELNK